MVNVSEAAELHDRWAAAANNRYEWGECTFKGLNKEKPLNGSKERKANYKAYCFIACSQSDLAWNANCLSFQPHTLNWGCALERGRALTIHGPTHTNTLKILGGSMLYSFLQHCFLCLFPLFSKTWVLQPSSRANQAPFRQIKLFLSHFFLPFLI